MDELDIFKLDGKTIPTEVFEIFASEIRAIYGDVSVGIRRDGEISVQFPDEVEWARYEVLPREKNGFLVFEGFRNDKFFNGMNHEDREFWRYVIEEISKYNPNVLGLLDDQRNRPKPKLIRVK